MSPVRILLLEDSALDAELLTEQLRRGGLLFEAERVETRDDFVRALGEARHDLILSDYSLPSFDGVTALTLARELAPDVPFIFVSGVLGEEFAIEALKEGATDYVMKQRLTRLPAAVTRAMEEARTRAERRETEERMRLLVAELSHRVKNTLATVASMARLTLKRSDSLKAFETAFFQRLKALSDAHTLIFQANWGETDMRQVVERALSPFREGARGDGFRIDGRPVELDPKAALAVTLMLHELSTNATKYGALSTPEGRVDLSWRVEDDGRVRLAWRERGGPEVRPPEGKGFGHTLIERSTRYELDGRADVRFPPDGVEADIDFPLGRA
jgi:two-component sensor histidine kinase/CheY-like chemotaxis protein